MLRHSRWLGLGALLFMLCGQSPARSAPLADTILIVKHERKLYLLHDNFPLRVYRVALGLSPTGAKEHQWDFRTPEGSYIIDFRQRAQPLPRHCTFPTRAPADLKRSSTLHLHPRRRYLYPRRAQSTHQAALLLQNTRLDQRLHCAGR